MTDLVAKILEESRNGSKYWRRNLSSWLSFLVQIQLHKKNYGGRTWKKPETKQSRYYAQIGKMTQNSEPFTKRFRKKWTQINLQGETGFKKLHVRGLNPYQVNSKIPVGIQTKLSALLIKFFFAEAPSFRHSLKIFAKERVPPSWVWLKLGKLHKVGPAWLFASITKSYVLAHEFVCVTYRPGIILVFLFVLICSFCRPVWSWRR